VSTSTLAAVAGLLDANWRGHYTVPAGGLYPHQWSWDSAFIAIGLRHLSPRRAQQELDTLFSAQWADGRLPQIVFDRYRDEDYSPGDAFWRSDRIPNSAVVPSAGLVQPPNHAWAALLVHRADETESRRRRFLERAYPRLVAWHRYLDSRRRTATGLVAVVHPWESGMDNSPYWDEPLENVTGSYEEDIPRPDLEHAAETERPSQREYGKYLYLAARYRDADCDDSDAAVGFRVEDPAVNALFARSELALAEIAEELGQPAAYDHRLRAKEITDALSVLWHPELGIYVARDVLTGALQPYRTVSGLMPLLLPGLHGAEELVDLLRSDHFALGRAALVPSHDLTARSFDSSRYWRGPAWFNTAWLLAVALDEAGHSGDARLLAGSMVDLAVAHDFPEYIDPHTGEPRGTLRFSWTAALSLDISRRLLDART
jgi:hypothetical protein